MLRCVTVLCLFVALFSRWRVTVVLVVPHEDHVSTNTLCSIEQNHRPLDICSTCVTYRRAAAGWWSAGPPVGSQQSACMDHNSNNSVESEAKLSDKVCTLPVVSTCIEHELAARRIGYCTDASSSSRATFVTTSQELALRTMPEHEAAVRLARHKNTPPAALGISFPPSRSHTSSGGCRSPRCCLRDLREWQTGP